MENNFNDTYQNYSEQTIEAPQSAAPLQPAPEEKKLSRGRILTGGIIIGFLAGVIAAGGVFAFGMIRANATEGTGTESHLNEAGDLAGSLLSSYRFGNSGNRESAINAESEAKLMLLEQFIDQYYYDEVSIETKQDGMYKGLVASLDDVYSEYYNVEEMKELTEELTGTYCGIGAYVSEEKDSEYCAISGIIKGTPAEAAGLISGDIIYEVDGENMRGMELHEVVKRIKGEEGTVVHITFIRNGENLEVDLTRAMIDAPSVSSEMLDDGIGYLQITGFDEITTGQFETEFSALKEAGMKAMILDLRDNPGGSVSTVTAIAEYFLPEGLIFYQQDKYDKITEYKCKGTDFGIPLVVLVNEYSASASEILSGAIKDAGIGTLVGTTTYGKGVVQTMFSLRDGSGLKVTVADYYTRNGNNINKIGIEPDVECELDTDLYLEEGVDTQLEKAKEIILEKLQ